METQSPEGRPLVRCEGIYPGWDGAAGGASVLLLLAEDVGARGEPLAVRLGINPIVALENSY